MATEVKSLIIGAGTQGERYALAQREEPGSKIFIFDTDYAKSQSLAVKVEGEPADSLDEALNWSNLVYICTPDHLHTKIAAQAIKNGATVFCEKPLTTNLKEALYLQSLVLKHQTIFLVGNILRLTPPFLQIKDDVTKGKLGPLISIRSTYLHDMSPFFQPENWRLNQNYLYGAGAHPVDLIMWVANEPVIQVQAMTGIKVLPDYTQPEDYQIILKFASGLLGHVWLNAALKLPTHRTDLEVYGQKGTLIFDTATHILHSFYQTDQAFTSKAYTKEWTIPRAVKIINNLLQDKNAPRFPLPDIQEAVGVIKILAAAEESIQTGKTVQVK